MIARYGSTVWKLAIGILFVSWILSSGSMLPASAVTVNVQMDGTSQIIYDHNGAKMPTGEVIQIIYASDEAIHAPGPTGEATGGDSLIWTGVVGQGGLGDPPFVMGPGAFTKAFAGGQSLIDYSRIYVRAWNGPSVESSTYYGNSQLSTTLDAGVPPMPQFWSVPTFYASTELAALYAPLAPSNATLEVLGTASMELTWQDNSNNEQGFRIEMSTSETWTDIVTATVDANVTSYEADGLATDEAYWFRVSAYNISGYSDPATAESRYTLANAPVNPPSVLGVNVPGYSCVISWESGGAQTGFEVYRNYPANSPGATPIYTGTAITTVDADPDANNVYFIYAYNGDNVLTTYVSSADSDALPGTPEGLVISNITTDDAYGTWEAVSGAGSYVIRYGTQESVTDALVTTDEAAYTFTMLNPATEYFWKVAAVNINGTSEFSSVASFTTEALSPPVPNLPAELDQFRSDGITAIATGEWINESTVEISMSMTSPIASILSPEVEIEPVGTDFNGRVTATGEGVPYSVSPVTGIITLENLAEWPYHWQVRVRDAAGHTGSWESFGGNAESSMDVGVDMTPPTLPILQSPLPGTWMNTQTPTFEWIGANDAPSGLAKYELWIDGVTNEVVPSTMTSAEPVAPLSSGVHTWEVNAVDLAGNVSSSSSWEVNIDTVPLAVSLVTPESNATGVFLFPNIMATFNKGLTESTVTFEYFEVTGSKSGSHETTNLSYNDSTQTVTFNQAGEFATSETVTCTVDTGVQDKAGNPMAYPYTWSFTTTSEVPPATNVTVKVYLQGYYNAISGTQESPATVEVQLRQGSDPGTAHTIAGSQEIILDATGTGTADINVPAGSFYVEVQHAGISFESNHLSVITNSTKNFGSGPVIVDLADGTDPAYTPTASPSAEWTETDGKLSMRGGNANGDPYIRIDDFGIWLAANGLNAGESGFDPRADFNGDGLIRIDDFGIWLSNNGVNSYAPVP